MRRKGHPTERSPWRWVQLAVPSALLFATLLGPQAPRLHDPDWLRSRPSEREQALVSAFVFPRLSVECIVAVVEAIQTCSSPVAGGAVACGIALLRILETCP